MPEQTVGEPAVAARRRILALLAAFSLVSYALRTNISIAAALMRTDLHLSQLQLGYVFTAFMVGYAVFQVPAGALGDRFGPRLVLTVAATIWGLTTVLTGALPGLIGGAAATLGVLLAVRFVLGIAEAATYPVAVSAVGAWMPASERAFSVAVVIAGMPLGSALMPPLITRVMVATTWRMAFYATSLLAFLLAALWWWYARDVPSAQAKEAERVPNDVRRQITAAPGGAPAPGHPGMQWSLMRNRNMLLISASYFLDSYVLAMFVFWFFLYLVDERHFSILSSGIYSSLPWLVSLVIVPAAGRACDVLSSTRGPRTGRRAVAMAGLLVASALLAWGARTAHPMLAIAVLSLSVAAVMSTEGPYWSSAVDISGAHAGTAGGIMNTAGNLGGVAATSLVPVLVGRFGWTWALASGSAAGLTAAVLWLLIRADQIETPQRD